MIASMATRGPLEQAVMELLWASTAPRSVADALEELNKERELAYTTVMTVLDRLAKKGMVTRERVERAWQYQPADSHDVVVARVLAMALEGVPAEVRVAALRVFCDGLPEAERSALLSHSPGPR